MSYRVENNCTDVAESQYYCTDYIHQVNSETLYNTCIWHSYCKLFSWCVFLFV